MATCWPMRGAFRPVSSLVKPASGVTRRQARGRGLGHSLMEQAMSAVKTQWGEQPIRIGAQARLKKFYSGHGFVDAGKPYIEDGIDHLEMVWQPSTLEPGVSK